MNGCAGIHLATKKRFSLVARTANDRSLTLASKRFYNGISRKTHVEVGRRANLSLPLASVTSPTSVEKPVVQDAIEKADLLIEAMGWIRQFRDKITVIKLGGSVMEDPDALRHLLVDIVFMETVGMRPIVVHGGGAAITRAMAEAKIEPRFIQGRRYTDDATLELSSACWPARSTNRSPRGSKSSAAGRCRSTFAGEQNNNVLFGERLTLTGDDGKPIDLGHVGRVTRVDRDTIENLCYAGQVPVIPSMCETESGERLNVNADTAATAVAQALGAEKLVFLSDVNGVRRDKNDPDSLIHSLTAERAHRLIAERGDRSRHDPQSRGLPGNAGKGRAQDSHHRRPDSPFADAGNLHEPRHRHRDRRRDRPSASCMTIRQSREHGPLATTTR